MGKFPCLTKNASKWRRKPETEQTPHASWMACSKILIGRHIYVHFHWTSFHCAACILRMVKTGHRIPFTDQSGQVIYVILVTPTERHYLKQIWHFLFSQWTCKRNKAGHERFLFVLAVEVWTRTVRSWILTSCKPLRVIPGRKGGRREYTFLWWLWLRHLFLFNNQ